MKHLAVRPIVTLITFFIGLLSVALVAPLGFNPISDSNAEKEILQVEREYIQAHLDKDIATLERILANDFTFGDRRLVESKAQRLAELKSPDFDFEAIRTSNIQVEVNGDSATVTGEAYTRTFQYDVEVTSPTYRFKRLYEKRDGRWQIVAVRVGAYAVLREAR